MVIDKLSGALFPSEGTGADRSEADASVPLSPEAAAAGLLLQAARRDGRVTEVECDRVDACLMRLLRLTNPKAKALRAEAQGAQARLGAGAMPAFAEVAKALPADARDQLIGQLWTLSRKSEAEAAMEEGVLGVVETAFGTTRERSYALRPA